MAIAVCRSVPSLESKPIVVKTCCELPGVWDRIWGFYDDNSAEEYSGCYGRSTVVSDVDGVRVCPECRWRKCARAGL
jgi:hypothetical protein